MRAARRFVLAVIVALSLPISPEILGKPKGGAATNDGFFLGRRKVAIFEVKSIGPYSLKASEFPGISVRSFDDVLHERESLPASSGTEDLTLVVRQGVGSEGRTKTPTCSCDNTSLEEPT
jgi:hypothetical protein